MRQAGRLLAHVLMGGGHGDRPVRLIGHSMGARVIFHALLELCRHNCKGDLALYPHPCCCSSRFRVRPLDPGRWAEVLPGPCILRRAECDGVLTFPHRPPMTFYTPWTRYLGQTKTLKCLISERLG